MAFQISFNFGLKLMFSEHTASDEWSHIVDGCVCDPGMDCVRWTFNQVSPSSLDFRDVIITSDFGNTTRSWQRLRSTNSRGNVE